MFGLVFLAIGAAQPVGAVPPVFSAERSRIFLGDWAIENSEKTGNCTVGKQFGAYGSGILIIQSRDGSAGFGAGSWVWLADKDKAFDVELVLDGKVGGGGRTSASGGPGAMLKHFAVPVSASFIQKFSGAKNLKILVDKVMVDNLDLDGAAPALAAFEQCLAQQRPAS